MRVAPWLRRVALNAALNLLRIEGAHRTVLGQGLRTADIALPGEKVVGTQTMGAAVVAALQ